MPKRTLAGGSSGSNFWLLAAPLAVLLVAGCSSNDSGAPAGGGGGGSSVAGQAGTPSAGAGAGGSSSTTGGSGAGQGPSAGTGTGGTTSPTAGSGGSGGTSAGGAGGSSVGGGGTASGGSGGGSGGGGSMPSGKGAAAKDVCPAAGTYTDPSKGIGTVSEVMAPQGAFFAFIEGPIWVATAKTLFFSDNAGSPERIWALDPTTKAVTKVLEGSGSNGLAVDPQDQIIAADQADKAVYRFDPATKMKVGANFGAASYKPNDVVVRSDGTIYVSDPDTGVWYIPSSGGAAQLATKSVSRPNGIELSLDETKLIVGDVGNQSITTFPIGADGKVTDTPTAFGKTMGQTADGMCMDCAGNLYVGTQTGVDIIDPSGKFLGTVPTGESSNCTFGGDDRKTLFVTSRAVLKIVKLANPGLPN